MATLSGMSVAVAGGSYWRSAPIRGLRCPIAISAQRSTSITALADIGPIAMVPGQVPLG